MEKDTLEKIKTRGYWRVTFRPTVFRKDKISSLQQCREIIQKAIVELRGWDYPHYPTHSNDHQGIYNGQDYVGSWIDWECYKEVWRIYQSGQFIHYFGMVEDWYNETSSSSQPRETIKSGSIFEIVHTVFRVTELFEFLARLIGQQVYKEGVNVKITLSKTNNRKLTILDPGRTRLWGDYIARISEIIFEKEYVEQEIKEKSKDLALDAIVFIFQRFNWNNPPIEVIKSDQKRLLERKF